MRSLLMTAIVLATLASVSQGQAPVDSLDPSTVHDSARVGSLIYRAATTLTYPKRDPLIPSDIEGDLTTILTIANTGATKAGINLSRCPVRTYAFIRGDYRPVRGLRGFHNTLSCMSRDQRVTLAPGESKKVSLESHNWKHGDAGWFGPIAFAAELQLPDTLVRLAAGKSATTKSLDSLDYHAVSSIEGVAPSKLVTTVAISNRGELPVEFMYGACAVDVFAFSTPDKSGKPAWVSNPDGICILVGYMGFVAPGHSFNLVGTIPTRDVMRAPLPAGRFYLTAELKINNRKILLDAGSVTISDQADPLPASRLVDSVQFSSSVKRVRVNGGGSDSLEVAVTARNVSHATRQLRPEGSCVSLLGYKTQERRDSYYSRPAYDNDWLLHGCQMPIVPFEVAPGGVRVFVKRMPAPPEPMYYTVFMSFFDDMLRTRDSFSVDLAADESSSP